MTRLQLGPPVSAAGVTITPLERVRTEGWDAEGHIAGVAEKTPVAILVESAASRQAYDAAGQAVDWEEMTRGLPT